MRKVYLLIGTLFIAIFSGCENSSFDIYRELEITKQDIKESNNLNFLKHLVVNGTSYRDDKLTPDISDGKLFGDRNLTKVEITRYFIYTKNITFEHRSSIFVDLNPQMVRYIESYSNQQKRIAQIISCKAPVTIISRKKSVRKKVSCKNDDFLPKGLLPPRLPDLSIGVDTPNVPGL